MERFIVVIVVMFVLVTPVFADEKKYSESQELLRGVCYSAACNKIRVNPCDDFCVKMVQELRQLWGDAGEVYWNNENFVVISRDGYVNEFRRDATTIHSGFIK